MPKENANSAQMGKKALFIVSSSSRHPLVILSKNQEMYFKAKKVDF